MLVMDCQIHHFPPEGNQGLHTIRREQIVIYRFSQDQKI
jgi:hypothetical protein